MFIVKSKTKQFLLYQIIRQLKNLPELIKKLKKCSLAKKMKN